MNDTSAVVAHRPDEVHGPPLAPAPDHGGEGIVGHLAVGQQLRGEAVDRLGRPRRARAGPPRAMASATAGSRPASSGQAPVGQPLVLGGPPPGRHEDGQLVETGRQRRPVTDVARPAAAPGRRARDCAAWPRTDRRDRWASDVVRPGWRPPPPAARASCRPASAVRSAARIRSRLHRAHRERLHGGILPRRPASCHPSAAGGRRSRRSANAGGRRAGGRRMPAVGVPAVGGCRRRRAGGPRMPATGVPAAGAGGRVPRCGSVSTFPSTAGPPAPSRSPAAPARPRISGWPTCGSATTWPCRPGRPIRRRFSSSRSSP